MIGCCWVFVCNVMLISMLVIFVCVEEKSRLRLVVFVRKGVICMVKDLVVMVFDFFGKLVIIIGVNSGLGFGLVWWLLVVGVDVIMVICNCVKGEVVVEEIWIVVLDVKLIIKVFDLLLLVFVVVLGE